MLYQASGTFAKLTLAELSALDHKMAGAWEALRALPLNQPIADWFSEITDIRRDLNAEWPRAVDGGRVNV